MADAFDGAAERARCAAAAGCRAALLSARMAKAELMAIPRGKPVKLSINVNAAAGAVSPLVKLCVGPSAVANRQGDNTQGAWPRLAAAAAAEVRCAGVFKRHEKTLEGWQLEGWTLVDHPEKTLVDYYSEQSELPA